VLQFRFTRERDLEASPELSTLLTPATFILRMLFRANVVFRSSGAMLGIPSTSRLLLLRALLACATEIFFVGLPNGLIAGSCWVGLFVVIKVGRIGGKYLICFLHEDATNKKAYRKFRVVST